MQRKHSAGKGDTYRKVDYTKWSKNYDNIFKKPKKMKHKKATTKRKINENE